MYVLGYLLRLNAVWTCTDYCCGTDDGDGLAVQTVGLTWQEQIFVRVASHPLRDDRERVRCFKMATVVVMVVMVARVVFMAESLGRSTKGRASPEARCLPVSESEESEMLT